MVVLKLQRGERGLVESCHAIQVVAVGKHGLNLIGVDVEVTQFVDAVFFKMLGNSRAVAVEVGELLIRLQINVV